MTLDVVDIEERIDVRRALAILGYRDVQEHKRVTGGWDTMLWRFATEGGRRAHSLRVYWLPRREEIAWRERIALEACAKAGLPAPRVEAVGVVEGLPALVLSWCPGKPLLRVLEGRPWAIWRLGRLFGRTQAYVHAIAPPSEFVARAPEDWVSRVTEEYADLADQVRSLQPSTESLIHMDFHPLNVISCGASVSGVVDWAGAAAGDVRADLARTVVTLLAAPAPPGPLRPAMDLARGVMLRAWRAGYEAVAGPMPDYRPFMAWAAATLLAEIEVVIDRPYVWGTAADLQRLRRLLAVWACDRGAASRHAARS